KMKRFIVLVMLVIPVHALSPNILLSNLIDQTCKQTPFYELCVASLQANPESTNADVKGLAYIMVGTINTKATDTLNVIDKLLGETTERTRGRQALTVCAELYDIIIEQDVKQAIEAIDKGDYKYAEQGTYDAAIEANSCEEEFGRNKSPLTDMNTLVHDVSIVAASIVKIIMRG
ncbi:PMEI domain-containing protein, partial [Cephalotus follicularis]